MLLCQNKKSAVSGFLVMVLIVTAGFVVIFFVMPMILREADTAAADSLCKGSVAIREKTYTEIKAPLPVVPDPKITSVSTPLLCRTSSFDLPENKNADKEEIKKEFADLVASCWNRYGEGLIEDVFRGEGSRAKNNCQVCYTINLRETSKFKKENVPKNDIKKENIITIDEFAQYLFKTPYKVNSEDDGCKIDGGFCIDSENRNDCSSKIDGDSSYFLIDKTSSACRKKGHTACCSTEFTCWNKGGICKGFNPDVNKFKEYNGWDCPSDMKCFIKNENHFTYGDYVQSFGGEGIIIATTSITPGDTYAISFGSPTETCGWCGKFKEIGAIAGALGGAALASAGVALIPFTLGTSLTLTAVGIGIVTGAATGFAVATVTTGEIDKIINEIIIKLFRVREVPTVYLTTLNQIQKDDLCSLVEST